MKDGKGAQRTDGRLQAGISSFRQAKVLMSAACSSVAHRELRACEYPSSLRKQTDNPGCAAEERVKEDAAGEEGGGGDGRAGEPSPVLTQQNATTLPDWRDSCFHLHVPV